MEMEIDIDFVPHENKLANQCINGNLELLNLAENDPKKFIEVTNATWYRVPSSLEQSIWFTHTNILGELYSWEFRSKELSNDIQYVQYMAVGNKYYLLSVTKYSNTIMTFVNNIKLLKFNKQQQHNKIDCNGKNVVYGVYCNYCCGPIEKNFNFMKSCYPTATTLHNENVTLNIVGYCAHQLENIKDKIIEKYNALQDEICEHKKSMASVELDLKQKDSLDNMSINHKINENKKKQCEIVDQANTRLIYDGKIPKPILVEHFSQCVSIVEKYKKLQELKKAAGKAKEQVKLTQKELDVQKQTMNTVQQKSQTIENTIKDLTTAIKKLT